jgi:hypothetical protein
MISDASSTVVDLRGACQGGLERRIERFIPMTRQASTEASAMLARLFAAE